MTPAQGDYSPTTTTGYDDQPTILAQWMQTHAWVEEFDLERVLYRVASAADSGAGFEMIEAVRRFFYHLSDVRSSPVPLSHTIQASLTWRLVARA